jgi:integrase
VLEIEKQSEEPDIHELYFFALKSPVTRDKYKRRLLTFFEFIGIAGESFQVKCIEFVNRSKVEGNQWAFNTILKFLRFHLERVNRKEITGSTIQNYLKSIKLLCEIADISIPWKKITRGLPRGRSYADDRIPSINEIQKMLEYPDRRIKAIIYTMASSGIRLGAWDYLRWGHIRPVHENEEILAAKIVAYSGEDEEYFSFISKEAYFALKDWMNYRETAGETITENSWLMRDLWDTQINTGTGLITRPKKLASSGIKRLIERAIWAQGLRKKLENGKRRHPFQAVHCFRKWFKTRCEIAGMKPINVEILLSHSVGISSSYYRPTETDLLQDYLKVSDLLEFDKHEKIQKALQTYEQKTKEESYAIKGKLQEKDDEIKNLASQFSALRKVVENMISNLGDIHDQDTKNVIVQSMFSSGLIKADKDVRT